MAHWSGMLGGGASAEQVASGIVTSPEYLHSLVRQQYQVVLNRPADAEGESHHAGLLTQGLGFEQLRAHLAGSQEFLDGAGGKPDTLIARLYEKLLGRSAVPDEVAGWVQTYDTQTAQVPELLARYRVALHIGQSDEGRIATVQGLYEQFLHRRAGADEMSGYVVALRAGVRYERLVAAFVGSAEYLSRLHQLNLIHDNARAVSGLVTRLGGGTVSATGADGTVFTLTVPPGALQEDRTITLTPLAAGSDVPLSGGLLAGVDFAPDGLKFLRPASLAITPPAGLPNDLIGFGYSGDGEEFHLRAVRGVAGAVTFPVTHFSGAGVGQGGPQYEPPLNYTEISSPYLNLLTAAAAPIVNAGAVPPSPSELQAIQAAWLEILLKWYDESLPEPLGQATLSDAALLKAGQEYNTWKAEAEYHFLKFLELPYLPPEIHSRAEAGLTLIGQGFVAALERSHAEQNDKKTFIQLWSQIQIMALEGIGGVPKDNFELADRFTSTMVLEAIGVPDHIAEGDKVTVTLRVLRRQTDGSMVPFVGNEVLVRGFGNGMTDGTSDPHFRTTDASGEVKLELLGDKHNVSGGVSGKLVVEARGGYFDISLLLPTSPPITIDGVEVIVPLGLAALGKSIKAEIPLSEVEISISPEVVTVDQGAPIQFTAEVTGALNTNVTWSATGGTIDNNGQYVAGDTPGTFTVTAQSVSDPEVKDEVTVTIKDVAVEVLPPTVTLSPGDGLGFWANVTGTVNTAVTWNATGGTMDANGLYIAGSQPGTYTVTARSVADTTKTSEATVTIEEDSGIVVVVTPSTKTLVGGKSWGFGAYVNGAYVFSDMPSTVTWEATGGTIDASGYYTAGYVPGTYVVTARSVEDPTKTGHATVIVTGPEVSISPEAIYILPGETYSFGGGVSGAQDTSLTWEATGGTIDENGLYTAGNVPGSYKVTARSVADPTKTAEAIVELATAVYPGDLTITATSWWAQTQGQRLVNVEEVTGDLYINYNAFRPEHFYDVSPFANLKKVHGSVVVHFTTLPKLTDFHVTTVGRNVSIRENMALGQVDLGMLEQVGDTSWAGNLHIINNPSLTQVSIGDTQMTGFVKVSNNGIGSLSVGAIHLDTSVGSGTFFISRNTIGSVFFAPGSVVDEIQIEYNRGFSNEEWLDLIASVSAVGKHVFGNNDV